MANKVDTAVIERAVKGDQKAYAEILREYRGPIYSLIYRMVRNREEAEDLVQEAFVKAFSSLSSFNANYAFSTWLYKIAINNCIDYLRRKKLKTYSMDKPIRSQDGELSREFPDVSMSPDRALLAKERSTLIEHAIDDLPEKYRIVIILRHSEERSYEEIADLLSIPLGTVKARIFRAREMLKKKLKKQLFP